MQSREMDPKKQCTPQGCQNAWLRFRLSGRFLMQNPAPEKLLEAGHQAFDIKDEALTMDTERQPFGRVFHERFGSANSRANVSAEV